MGNSEASQLGMVSKYLGGGGTVYAERAAHAMLAMPREPRNPTIIEWVASYRLSTQKFILCLLRMKKGKEII